MFSDKNTIVIFYIVFRVIKEQTDMQKDKAFVLKLLIALRISSFEIY